MTNYYKSVIPGQCSPNVSIENNRWNTLFTRCTWCMFIGNSVDSPRLRPSFSHCPRLSIIIASAPGEFLCRSGKNRNF